MNQTSLCYVNYDARPNVGCASLSLLLRDVPIVGSGAGWSRLGATTIRRVLHDAGSSYQKTRTWCPTGTAERKRKSGVVTVADPKTEEKRG